ncbi:hypothetical protein, partial [Ralstonia sp. UBA689]|uniref:hypothetical protein n=1 Tax=Ralstonia sp. UBA689 TaxID=1947373 RepID=UPI0025EBCE3B
EGVVQGRLLAGCSGLGMQFTNMSEADSSDRARLRVISNGFVKGIPGRDCVDWSAKGAGTLWGGIVGSSGYRGRSLSMPDAPSKDVAELYVEANQPITLVFQTTPESWYQCSVAASFVPKANQDYEARFDLNSSSCGVNVRSLSEPNAHVELVDAAPC